MAIKTFNIDAEVYKKFREYCKEHGISMSKQVELFMKSQLAKSSEERKGHLEKLEKSRSTRHITIDELGDSL